MIFIKIIRGFFSAAPVDIKTWFIESALRYDWYIQDNLSLYGRLGITYWEMEKTQFAFFDSDAAGFSPIGELGVNYVFTPNVQLSVGYQYIDAIGNSNLGRYDSYGILASLSYTFGDASQPTIVESSHEEQPAIEVQPIALSTTVISDSQTVTFSLTNTPILFEHNSSELSDEAIDQLTEISSVLKPDSETVFIEVVGHTDSTGTELYNQTLSELRAKSIANKLIELGVAQEQIELRGEGESHPIADNNTDQGRTQNRRVEITINNIEVLE